MATSLPSPPTSRPSTPGSQPDGDRDLDVAGNIAAKLDALLEQYLELLDKYSVLREELSRTFSNGFFSLAQAQRNSSLGAGRRYGPDFYDERMKARRRTEINAEDDDPRFSVRMEERKPTPQQQAENPENQENGDNEGTTEKEGQRTKEEAEDGITTRDELTSERQKAKQRVKQQPGHRDPLTWFGLLVPPALRQTQSHFSQAVETFIPALSSLDATMRRLEEQIWACRRELAEETEAAKMESDVEAEGQVLLEAPEKHKVTPHKNVSSRRAQLTQRSAHARSQLLKLGD